MVQGRRSFFLFSAHLYIYTCLHVRSVFFFPHQSRGFSVLDGTSSAVVAAAARPASSPQVVPELNEGLTVLPDQLVTKQDVPAAAETEQRTNIYTLFLYLYDVFACFSEFTLNLSLTAGHTCWIYDITTKLEPIVVQDSVYTSVMWKLEASSEQTLRTDFPVK